MTSTLQRVRSILRPKSQNGVDEDGREGKPEVGFKIVHQPDRGEVVVKVIGARNLPTCYGNVKPQGYLVKVKLFPGREKFETEIQTNAWAYFNQEFTFPANIFKPEQFTGKFLTLTIYSVLDQKEGKVKLKQRASFREHIEAFVSSVANSQQNRRSELVRRNSSRVTLNNRRTIGAVTYNLHREVFTLSLKGRNKATPDIWRPVEIISSGVKIESRESKRGSVEVTMSYSNSEDGKNDMMQVSLSKWRCSMKTMQDHEKLRGDIYFNMAAFEYDVMVAKWKSNTFSPTISMKIESQTATMSAIINNYNIANVKIVIKIKCKNMVGKKSELGQIEIDRNSKIFKSIIASPTIPTTEIIDFV